MIMYSLVADIGNSFSKIALFREQELVRFERMEVLTQEEIKIFLDGITPNTIGIASVGDRDVVIAPSFRPFGDPVFISSMSALPISTVYGSRDTLGVDRIANAVAIRTLAAGRAALAIDTGTCLTYDFVSAEGVHQGGAISPGIRLRAMSMYEHSARLPYVLPREVPALIGGDTESSMASGIYNGVIAEIEGVLARYRTDQPDLYVVITGGDALSFQRAIKSAIFADPLLTLKGIYEILLHQ